MAFITTTQYLPYESVSEALKIHLRLPEITQLSDRSGTNSPRRISLWSFGLIIYVWGLGFWSRGLCILDQGRASFGDE